MIEFYRPAECAACAEIEEALKEMVLAHRVIVVETGQMAEGLPAGTPLPALKDNGKLITGMENVRPYMRVLEEVVFEWYKYQSDSCYVHDNRYC